MRTIKPLLILSLAVVLFSCKSKKSSEETTTTDTTGQTNYQAHPNDDLYQVAADAYEGTLTPNVMTELTLRKDSTFLLTEAVVQGSKVDSTKNIDSGHYKMNGDTLTFQDKSYTYKFVASGDELTEISKTANKEGSKNESKKGKLKKKKK